VKAHVVYGGSLAAALAAGSSAMAGTGTFWVLGLAGLALLLAIVGMAVDGTERSRAASRELDARARRRPDEWGAP
jgi:predicted lipid-binding transport protein (Tim44 family)